MEIFKLFGSILVNTDEAEQSISKVDKKAGSFASKLGSGIATAAKWSAGLIASAATASAGVVAAIFQMDEATEEHRQNMGKLATAYEAAGADITVAKEAYAGLYRAMGDTGAATEASQLLAKLATNTKDVEKWTRIATGVVGTFGDALPVESLIEAANETAKVGEVTGALADALNWAGISEEEFNEKLAACGSEQERNQMITETLAKTYESAAAAFEKNNEQLMANRESQIRLNEAMSDAGAKVEEIKSKISNYGTELLIQLMPAVESILTIIQENLPLVQKIFEQFAPGIVGMVESLLPQLMKLAEAVLPVLMELLDLLAPVFTEIVETILPVVINLIETLLPPLMDIVETVLPLLLDLLQPILDLIQPILDSLSPLMDMVEDLIPQILELAESVLPVIVELMELLEPIFLQLIETILPVVVSFMQTLLPLLIDIVEMVLPLLLNLLQPILDLLQPILDLLSPLLELVVALMEPLQPILELVIAFLEPLVSLLGLLTPLLVPLTLLTEPLAQINELLGPIIEKVTEVSEKLIGRATESLQRIADYMKGFIPNMIQSGKDLFNGLWEGAKNIWDSIQSWTTEKLGWILTAVLEKAGQIVSRVKDSLQNLLGALTEFVPNMVQAGKKLFNGLWDGVKGIWSSMQSWVTEKINWLLDKITFWDNSKSAMADGSHASGLPYVPYDGYRAILHRGESVLNAADTSSLLENIKALAATGGSSEPITIVVKTTLDGKQIGESVTKYQRNQARAVMG